MTVRSPQKLEQGRAAFAFNEVEQSVNNSSIPNDNYASYIKRMPSMIQVNGLAQALAFYYSKAKGDSGDAKAYKSIYKSIGKWLEETYPQYFTELDNNYHYIKAIINVNSADYRLLTVETMALLDWMKRFVSGMVGSRDEN